MGVDYCGAGGVGIEIDHTIVKSMIENNVFTEEDWEDDPGYCLSETGLSYIEYGDCYSGEVTRAFVVDAETFGELLEKVDDFCNSLSKHGINVDKKDLKIFSELLVY